MPNGKGGSDTVTILAALTFDCLWNKTNHQKRLLSSTQRKANKMRFLSV